MAKKLLVAISFHGFGHIAQTAPVINRFQERNPDVAITLLSAAPRELLEKHFRFAFEHVREALDFGMLQSGALDVLVEESHARYVQLHEGWSDKVSHWARYLEQYGFELVIADVPYLILEAAHHAGIPSIAMCSLNWLDIYREYCGHLAGAEEILQQMQTAYNRVEVFLCPEPSMHMKDIKNTRDIGPIARTGKACKEEICERLGISLDSRLVLFTLGGTQTSLDISNWPQQGDIHYLVQMHQEINRTDIHDLNILQMPFEDLITSCDAFVIKPGYGSFAEAACNAASVLYVRRAGWPEEPYLVEWLEKHVHCREIKRAELESGRIIDSLEQLWSGEKKPAVQPTGIVEAVRVLEEYL